MFQVTGYNSIRSMSFSVRVDEKRRADERRAATATARHTAAARARASRRIALRGPVRPKGVTLYRSGPLGGEVTSAPSLYVDGGDHPVQLRRMPAFRARPYTRPEDRRFGWGRAS